MTHSGVASRRNSTQALNVRFWPEADADEMGVRRNQSARSGLLGHHSDAGSAQRSLTTAPSMKLSTAEAAMSITSGKAG
jgi:hypothetical protein